ncbi:alpha/beta fold hydrolase [Anaplasma phagocytophilum]|uniref:Hydrolase, alpha/beta fold family n=2 Tax=Anaplasma phagocytophilum TaxID=948 RepID=Q2GLN7_ANAPZ|nr:alpha/beta hydrolase [Anaplasma phagocytophilum]ABD43830.1 hydrolase, alpha/beta fold family [Anaplasma phagocytophilum str. HZ]AGR79187.1 hypothetical protein YYU_00415 [Anaplasma phagocytophilum str. HZ2]KJV68556.1 alpha/beta hydrolase fold family protein [Anaplasma phagocytophilum str. NCH-1]KJV88423.1 alpha/beta hydrolase fold family protein [Anaplasma phagocytophilum str. ApNYW]
MTQITEGRITIPAHTKFDLYYRVHNVELLHKGLPLVCVHGISGNCMDFEYLGKAVSNFAVITPDMPGRGYSDWFEEPENYNYNTYCTSVLHLMRHLCIRTFNFLGTSMGGIVGMFLAARFPNMLNSLILNDVGPCMRERPLRGIVQFLLQPMVFKDLLTAKQYLRSSFAHFGIEKEEHWEHLEQHCIIERDGDYALRFDPKIGIALQDEAERVGYVMNLWDVWDKLKCAILVLRGECSNILTADILRKMLSSKENIDYILYKNVGHAPALFQQNRIDDVLHWLNKTSTIHNM